MIVGKALQNASKNYFSPFVQSRRPRELGMFIALRYLVTVRRATVMPCFASSSTISSSDSGLVLSSLSTISCSLIRTLSQATSSPSAARGAAAEEPLEREDAARRLDPLVVDGPADGRDVDADLVGDLLHLQRLDVTPGRCRGTWSGDRRSPAPRG